MSSIICRIQPLPPGSQNAVKLPLPLMKEWGCQPGQSIRLRVGGKSLITRIVPTPRKQRVILLPRSMAAQLSLPFYGETRVSFQKRELSLGPVLAILTTGFQGAGASPFGARSGLYRLFLQASKGDRPFFYIFTPEMVNWNRQVINGWFYRRDSSGSYRWIRKAAPFPDVVYERVPNRKAESQIQVQECKKRLQAISRTHFFNQGFFNKWKVHEAIYNHPLTVDCIPESRRSPSLETVQEMLDRHKMVYLKPSGGSLGLGIFRITQIPQGGYYCRFRIGNQNILRQYRSLRPLMQQIFGARMKRLPNYLVQQGIRLIKYQGRPVDFRVHMHKDRTGQWKVVAIGAKVAGIGSVTTHGRTGGSLLSTSELLKQCFSSKSAEVEERIRNTSVRICTALENRVGGPLGELGLDIGVEKNGKVWLFEANSKPGRHIFKHPSLSESGKESARCITQYSLTLAQF